MMLEIVRPSLRDLADRHILGVLLRSLLITFALFAVLGVALGWLLAGTDPCSLIDAEPCVLGLSGSSLAALLIAGLAAWRLFPAMAVGVICAYGDKVAGIIEARHYPEASAGARPVNLRRAVLLGLRSLARVLIYNLVALPFYIVLMITGIGPLILFVLVNGAAFGRDLGETVAARHGDRASRTRWLRLSRASRIAIGSFVTALFFVPFINLLAPILGMAMTTHLHHLGGRAETTGRAL